MGLGRRIVGVELLCAAQAIDLRGAGPLGAGAGRGLAAVREVVAFAGRDQPYPSDLEPLVGLVASGALAELVR